MKPIKLHVNTAGELPAQVLKTKKKAKRLAQQLRSKNL